MALMILLVLMVAMMVPMLAQADCADLATDPVHCGGDPEAVPPTGFIGVDVDGACYGISSDGPLLGEGPCPEH
jgi:hypothetical protein